MAKLTQTDSPHRPQPTINLTEDELPEIKDWKVGGKYAIKLMVEMVRQSKGDVFMQERDRKMEGSFKIMKAMGMGKHEEMMKPDEKAKMEAMKKKMEEY